MTEKVTEGGATFILEPTVNQDEKNQKGNKDQTESGACSCKRCSVLVFCIFRQKLVFLCLFYKL